MTDISSEPDYGALEKKRLDLLNIALEAIPSDWENRQEIAESIVAAFVELSPPSQEQHKLEYLTLERLGANGGSSRKAGNLLLDWTNLFKLVPDVVLTATAASAGPWALPFVALHVWNTVWAASRIEISPRHAMCLYAMWQHCDGYHRISEEDAFLMTNRHLAENNVPQLTQRVFAEIIDDLCAIDCVELQEGLICLREWVRKSY